MPEHSSDAFHPVVSFYPVSWCFAFYLTNRQKGFFFPKPKHNDDFHPLLDSKTFQIVIPFCHEMWCFAFHLTNQHRGLRLLVRQRVCVITSRILGSHLTASLTNKLEGVKRYAREGAGDRESKHIQDGCLKDWEALRLSTSSQCEPPASVVWDMFDVVLECCCLRAKTKGRNWGQKHPNWCNFVFSSVSLIQRYSSYTSVFLCCWNLSVWQCC